MDSYRERESKMQENHLSEAEEREMLLADIRRIARRMRQMATHAHEVIDEEVGHSAFVEAVTGRRVPRESMRSN